MRFVNAETLETTRRWREARWAELLQSRPDAQMVLAFAEKWADKMEQLRDETRRPIWKLVDLSLRRLVRARRQLTDEQFEFALKALLECWGYQSGLSRWAQHR